MSISWDSLPNSRDAERVMLHNVINEYKEENEKLKEDNEKLKKLVYKSDPETGELTDVNRHSELVLNLAQISEIFEEEIKGFCLYNGECDFKDFLCIIQKARDNTDHITNLNFVIKCSEEEVTIQRNRATQIQHKLHQSQAENEKLKKVISDSLTRKVKTKSPGDVFDNATKKLDELHEQICQTETDYFKKLKEDPNWECGFK